MEPTPSFPPRWLQEGSGARFGDEQKQVGTQGGEGIVEKDERGTGSIVPGMCILGVREVGGGGGTHGESSGRRRLLEQDPEKRM